MEADDCQELECIVCIQRYSDQKIPRNQVCGHSVCTSCLEELIKDDKHCPECRTPFTETKPSDLPINYPLLRISRIITHAETNLNVYPELCFPLTSPSSELRQNAGKCSFHGSTMYFMCISCSVWVCRFCVDAQHPDPPRGKCLITSVEDAIEKLKCIHTKNLECCIDEVNLMKKKLGSNIKDLEVASKCIKFQNNNCDSGFTNNITYFESHSNICNNTALALNEMQCALTRARDKISNSNTPQEINESIKMSNESQVSFEYLLEKEKKRELPDLSLEKLLRGKGLKDLLKEGTSVFVERNTDSNSWAKIVLKNDKLHLYSLMDGSTPEDGFLLPYNSVRVLVPKQSPVLFLEIGWGSEVKGVVYVRMYGDTARGRNAICLCSGGGENSYKKTDICAYSTHNGQRVVFGGKYYKNGVTTGIPVVDGITYSSDYVHKLKAGLFYGAKHVQEEEFCNEFYICLSDSLSEEKISSGFGFVEDGLDILEEMYSLQEGSPTSHASVMDCGLVIPV